MFIVSLHRLSKEQASNQQTSRWPRAEISKP